MALPITSNSPLEVYIDASVMIDYCLATEPRHNDAVRLIDIFERNSDLLIIHASKWTWMETHGILYTKLIEASGINFNSNIPNHKYPHKSPRTYFPPLQRKLRSATSAIENKYAYLKKVLRFDLSEPDDTVVRVLHIAQDLAQFGGIYPQDSFHVATGIRLRCKYFITNDGDLLDRLCTSPCKGLVEKHMIESSAPLPSKGFIALPTTLLHSRRKQRKQTVFQHLARIGIS